jgi:hypothetical protein
MTAPVHRIRLGLFLALVCAGGRSLAAQDTPPATREDIAAVAENVRAALSSGSRETLRTALQAAIQLPDKMVVVAVEEGLAAKDTGLVLETLQALRWIDHPRALEALHRTAKDRKLRTNPELAGPLWMAIGQHGDPSSIEILVRDPFEVRPPPGMQARILALGRIRTKASLSALMELLALSYPGGTRERELKPWMEEVRLSLVMLTGVDQGPQPELWESWWRDNKKTFDPERVTPVVPKALQERWDRFWGTMGEGARSTRREDRGG